MASDRDNFSMRVALALVKQEQQQQPGGFVARRTPKTGLGALRDLFHSVARPDEREPAAIVIGLECADQNTYIALQRDMSTDARDVLLLYPDHLLLIGNPVRGAGLGTLLKLFATGFTKQGKANNAPHSSMQRTDLHAAELVAGRPEWATDEQFVRLKTNAYDLWFWVDLAVDTEEHLSKALESLHSPATGS